MDTKYREASPDGGCLQILADVSEDLAIELLSQFTEDDLPHLTKTAERLIRSAALLKSKGVMIPFPVEEFLRHFSKSLS